jgi:hypothetical protein
VKTKDFTNSDRKFAIKVLECMAIDITGGLAGLSKTNPMVDVLEQRIEAVNCAQEALRKIIHIEKENNV